ncbi:MAG: TonB-dependent receptor, partial [Bacteroidota bacterium]
MISLLAPNLLSFRNLSMALFVNLNVNHTIKWSKMFNAINSIRNQNRFRFVVFVLFFFISQISLLAGTTGKISGIVTDATTGEVIPGCNIMVVGSTMGAASDINGEYFILNIPPGTYTIRATMVGYKNYIVDQVQVITDLTTKIDFEMVETSLEMDEEVVVVAERALVQKDETSKQAIVSSEDIMNMPVNSIQEILTTKAGFTVDANGDLHVRGGRSDEISYMVDGVKMEDPLYRETNNNFNKDAINEMVIISGT